MDFSDKPGDKIQIGLSGSQWELLRSTRQRMDQPLARCVSVALRAGETYQLFLSPAEFKALIVFLVDEAERTGEKKRREALSALADWLAEIAEGTSTDADEFWGPEKIDNRSEMTGGVYVLKVSLADEKSIWRRIALRGGQTLHDLHMAIFRAFDREEAHLYSFYIPPKPVSSRSIRRFTEFPEYTHPYGMNRSEASEIVEMFETFLGPFSSEQVFDAAQTQLQSLSLVEQHRFLYLFDFGDEWLHWVTVEHIDGVPDEDPYPRILERQGDSPPQYAFQDDDEDEWTDDE